MGGTQQARSGRVRTMVAAVGAAAALVVVPSPAAAGTGPVVIAGTAVSELPADTRVLAVHAAGGGGVARGGLQFRHDSPQGLSWFTAAVDCLVLGPQGVVELSGRVVRGRTAAGVDLGGRDWAFTVSTGSSPQSFSLPRFAPGGTMAPCSGGRPDTVAVSRGELRVTG